MATTPYSKMSTDDFDRLLRETINDTWPTTCQILDVPGVYELVSEHLNNEVLERWRAEQPQYAVLVGNLGTVYDGIDGDEAVREYLAYVLVSRDGSGRAAGEPVTLLCDDEPIREYEPAAADEKGGAR